MSMTQHWRNSSGLINFSFFVFNCHVAQVPSWKFIITEEFNFILIFFSRLFHMRRRVQKELKEEEEFKIHKASSWTKRLINNTMKNVWIAG